MPEDRTRHAPTAARPVLRRLADTDSITELTDLLHRAYEQLADMGLRYWATHQTDDQTRERIDGGECYVAVLDGRLVGTILFEDATTTGGCPYFDRSGVASFHQFGVDPDLQGHGIGGQLLDLAERRAVESGARELALDTAVPATHLIAMYERRGYRIVDRQNWDETNYESVIMSRPVTAIRAGTRDRRDADG